VKCMQFDDTKLICGAGDHLAIFENCFSNAPLRRRMLDGQSVISSLRFDQEYIFTGSLDGTIRVWDIDDFTISGTFDVAQPVTSVRAAAPKLFSCTTHSQIRRHDINTAQVDYQVNLHTAIIPVSTMDLADDGHTIAVCTDTSFVVIDTRSGIPVHHGPPIVPYTLTFCHGLANPGLVYVVHDAGAMLYDISMGTSKGVVSFDHTTIGHSLPTSVYSSHGIVGTGFSDFGVRLWDVKTGHTITNMFTPCGPFSPQCIAFDETKILCGSLQTKVHMYTFGTSFRDQYGVISDLDQSMIRKWNARTNFYQAVKPSETSHQRV